MVVEDGINPYDKGDALRKGSKAQLGNPTQGRVSPG